MPTFARCPFHDGNKGTDYNVSLLSFCSGGGGGKSQRAVGLNEFEDVPAG